jgi:hypothetical protein
MHMSINIATFYTCPGKSAKVPDNLTQCPGIGLKNYGMYVLRIASRSIRFKIDFPTADFVLLRKSKQ